MQNRATLPVQLKAAYDARLAALTADDEDDDEGELDDLLDGMDDDTGAGSGLVSVSSPRPSSRGKGRKSLASAIGSPTVAVAAAGLKQQLKVRRTRGHARTGKGKSIPAARYTATRRALLLTHSTCRSSATQRRT